ncbi:hypothetical protein G9A89_021578 [Geosiphon pyriformis]|nr:hypothetical protein G9A89_021578 [Geosiphon pyriformis]
MEKSHLIQTPSADKAMIAFSGGPSSRCMLQLLHDYCEPLPHEISKKRVFSSIEVCHVDESIVFQAQEHTVKKIEKITQQYGYHYIGLHLEDIFSPEFTPSGTYNNLVEITFDDSKRTQANELMSNLHQENSLSNAEKLRSLFENVSKFTSKEDFLWHLKLSLLIQAARKRGCTRLFMGECSTRISIKIISLTSKGRGFSLPFEIAGENAWFEDIIILRPMKDMLSKEIGIYNRFLGFDTVITLNFTSMKPARSSIEKLTEDFIIGLEKEYPSTVSTIFRTGCKLTPSESTDPEQICALCMMPYQKGVKDWQNRITVHAREFYNSQALKQMSDLPSNSTLCKNILCLSNDCCASNYLLGQHSYDISNSLCYGCLVNMRDIKKVELPPYVADTLEKANLRKNLRNQIKDFLLDDEED